MEMRQRVVFVRTWVCASREAGVIPDSSVLTCVRSGYSASVKRDEQDETFVVSPLPFVAETDGIAGDQLRCDIQLWLSPPDPSTNHNFVWKARHRGTAAWFFESNTFTEWKARGSLLWIHGKRMFFFRIPNEYLALIVS